MYMYIHIYMCVYIYIHSVHMHTYILVYTNTYIHTYIQINLHTHTHTHTHTCSICARRWVGCRGRTQRVRSSCSNCGNKTLRSASVLPRRSVVTLFPLFLFIFVRWCVTWIIHMCLKCTAHACYHVGQPWLVFICWCFFLIFFWWRLCEVLRLYESSHTKNAASLIIFL